MAYPVDKNYFQELAHRDPAEICKRTLCEYDHIEKRYIFSAWNDRYLISPGESRIELVDKTSRLPHEYFYLFIIYYLLESRIIEPTGEWISEKDIPGGTTFFRGPHEIPTHLICTRFQNDTAAFQKKCEQLYGHPIAMGDAAYRFDITPCLPVAVLFWAGDDDFPSEAKLLYDRTIIQQLPTDIIFALAIEICSRIGS